MKVSVPFRGSFIQIETIASFDDKDEGFRPLPGILYSNPTLLTIHKFSHYRQSCGAKHFLAPQEA